MEEYVELVQENEELRAQVHNLTLYLHDIEKALPGLFANIEDGFDGMPGYVSPEAGYDKW